MKTKKILYEGYHKIEPGGWEIVVNHHIKGVSPAMITWWWDHIDTTERYRLWHPTDHVSFEWVVSPATQGHVGAVHRVQEFFNGIPAVPATLEIRWEDPSKAVDAEYEYVLLASGLGEVPGKLMHEYQEAAGGTRMRSHFSLAADTPENIIAAIYEHNKQEMQRFTEFLPELYWENR